MEKYCEGKKKYPDSLLLFLIYTEKRNTEATVEQLSHTIKDSKDLQKMQGP